ncbi:ribonuclease H-like domain-containing protein [Kalaharituber pfeilii]|nr:ribonuclease H-like domain-containing protein [Kalaharituber pfeilii]
MTQTLRELEKWQYRVARSITGAPWGTRRDVVEGLSNLESVETFVRWEATRVEARTLRFGDEKIRREDGEKEYLRGSLAHGKGLPLAVLPSIQRGAEKEEWERHISQNTDEGWTPVYTDGSRRGGRAGAGAWWGTREKSWYLGEEATVNDAELVAISEVMGRVEGELMILTDSRHAIRRMRAVAGGDVAYDGATNKMRKAWEERARRGDLDVAVMWVKAHAGIEGNERADRSAGWGTALQYKAEVVTESGQRQRARGERAEERNRLGMSYRPLEKAGREIGRLAGLLGGKGLRAWRWKIGEGDGPECRWCGEREETTDHLLKECRVWKRRWPGERST